MTPALDNLNSTTRTTAIAMVTPLVELSGWVAEATVDSRPFKSEEALAEALVETILKASMARRIAMFKVHPELAGREAVAGQMTPASESEQGRLGLLDLTPDDMAQLSRLNAAYQRRFGHPFIIALHRVPNLKSLFEIFERRLGATALEEHITTLAEIASVICARTAEAFGPDTSHSEPLSHFSKQKLEQLP